MENRRLDLLKRVVADMDATKAQFSALLRTSVNAHPLLYFGDPLSAKFATFGVNPSASEFTQKRWPNTMADEDLDQRSAKYFLNPKVPAYLWFEKYETTLKLLGHSYSTDTVHLDLSPRATKSMRSVDRGEFAKMIVHDMKWFLAALGLCRNLKAAIMSGSVTGRYHFDTFLLTYLPKQYSLKMRTRFEDRSPGGTALYDLIGPNLNIPVFFCSQSPSGDGGVFLKGEVTRLKAHLTDAGFSG